MNIIYFVRDFQVCVDDELFILISNQNPFSVGIFMDGNVALRLKIGTATSPANNTAKDSGEAITTIDRNAS